jgi:predicted ATPase
LIGANGAGKTNFIDLFRLLNEMVEGHLQLAVQRAGGANRLLYLGAKRTKIIRVELESGPNAYRAVWEPTADDGLVFAEEEVSYHGPSHSQPGNAYLGSGHRESQLPKASSIVAKHVLSGLRGWKVYHFHDTSQSADVKLPGGVNDNRYLRMDAGNLAAFLLKLRKTASRNYETIRNTVRMVAPFFDDFVLEPMAESRDQIRLEWREQGSDYPFLAHQFSDGTLRFICLATVLLQPDLPSTILIDEPELGLHPYAISVLASLVRSAAQRTQLIVSTQSVPLVNQFQADDLLVVGRKGNETVFERLDPGRLTGWLEDYSLGELWEKNVLGGRPAQP